jgi:hypothetical protein
MEQEVIDKIARSFVDALMVMDRELVKIEDVHERTRAAKEIVCGNIRMYLVFLNQRVKGSRDIFLNILRVLYKLVEGNIKDGHCDDFISKYNQILDDKNITNKTRMFSKFEYLSPYHLGDD